MTQLDPFTLAFFEAALWSTDDESNDSGGEPLDRNYSIDDIDAKTIEGLAAECAQFQAENAADLEASETWEGWRPPRDVPCKHGFMFWLNRCGHGVGFWDGDYPEPQASRLSAASEAFGKVDLYIGDDGKIYASGYES